MAARSDKSLENAHSSPTAPQFFRGATAPQMATESIGSSCGCWTSVAGRGPAATMLAGALRRGPSLIRFALPRLTELSPNLPASDGLNDRLYGLDLGGADPLFFGDAKVGLHSGIAAHRHGRSQVQHDRRSLVQDVVVPRRSVEGLPGLRLFRLLHLLLSFASPTDAACVPACRSGRATSSSRRS